MSQKHEDLSAILKRLDKYRETAPGYAAAIASFVDSEAMHSGVDPLEGTVVNSYATVADATVHGAVRRMLRARLGRLQP